MSALIGEIAKLKQIQQSLSAAANRTDAERKMETVALRRLLAVQVGIVGKAAEQDFLPNADAELAREFRQLISAMRRAIALHQANFPAVRMDEQSNEYHDSVKDVRTANANFFKWANVHLAA